MARFRLFFLLCLPLFSIAQAISYDIVIFGNVIGEAQAQRQNLEDGSIRYSFKSNAKAKVFFRDRTSQADVSIIYKNDKLKSATCKIERDGDWQFIQMERVNDIYKIDNDGEELIEENPIKFSSTMLFFIEPVGVQKIWIERLSDYASIEKVDIHKYKMKVDGKYNFYTYENGKLVEFMNKNIVNVYMHLKP
jgi:hypothetical protein